MATPIAQQGDPYLYPTPDGGEVRFVGGQPLMHRGFSNAIYISLLGQESWMNAVLPPEGRMNSRLLAMLHSATASPNSLAAVAEEAKNRLRWLTTVGAVKDVRVTAGLLNLRTIELTAYLRQPSGEQVYRYKITWDEQRVFVAAQGQE